MAKFLKQNNIELRMKCQEKYDTNLGLENENNQFIQENAVIYI